MKYRALQVVALVGLLAACASASPWDNPYTVDITKATPDEMLRNHDPKKDRPLSDCAAETLPSGEKQYPCVVHFNGDYKVMLDKISQLEDDLKFAQQQLAECQAGH